MFNLSEEDFGVLAVCSERYALGRRTYMPGLVCDIIKTNISRLSNKDIQVLINDIENPLFSDYGDSCDKDEWMQLLKVLKEQQVKNGN